ncbi:glycoside hydrolase family 31 protein [Chitinispirillales bacterium ANBcel5]|uniref:glycoside hydrolase family 31 protein n=1 Tax=Cellulosispirillum alkaliphilum TaxID=3039283 RepID=UPI002A5085A1|nr:glycoside hydrolase family 31 protein [Chitinispirillales bacterium ANBcel5]
MEETSFQNTQASGSPLNIPSHFLVQKEPMVVQESIVQCKYARFTVLSPRCIRIEFDKQGLFENRASQIFWYRKQPVPYFSYTKEAETHQIITDHLHLTYKETTEGFSQETLQIVLSKDKKTWCFGQQDPENLRGTVRTLDRCDGWVQLSDGLLSRSGWSVIDDSQSLIFNELGWLEQRKCSPGYKDLYFFGYGDDHKECIKDFFSLSGKPPLPPRWVFGNWWSRYWEYTQEELTELVADFIKYRIPLSVCVIDMDWHVVKNQHHSGWTGYTWNRDLFPSPQKLLTLMKQKGIRTALNLHPADGVAPHEKAYTKVARAMDMDPETQKNIPFDVSDPQFMEAYFKHLHHPHEEAGVDFWWIDWQQGQESKLEGLDPLFMLNHLHFYDLSRKGKRPLVFSRWCGPGGQRYPIGFSGDTYVTWDSLSFQPYFTATAANVGFGYWSNDVGGHYHGREDRELFIRWVQFGVFSPIFRIHCAKSEFQDRRPWAHDSETLDILRIYMNLRHQLIPYIYSSCHLGNSSGESLVRPMYHDYSTMEEAYECKGQYMFGSQLMVSPFVTPVEKTTLLSKQIVWFPPGGWYEFSTGEYIANSGYTKVFGSLRNTPVYARTGAIVPLAAKPYHNDTKNPQQLEINIFTGKNNRYTLYEDDGISCKHKEGHYCLTSFEQKWEQNEVQFTIEASKGDLTVIPEKRSYVLHFYGVTDNVHVNRGNQKYRVQYDETKEVLSVSLFDIDPQSTVNIALTAINGVISKKRERKREKLISLLKAFSLSTDIKEKVAIYIYENKELRFKKEVLKLLTAAQRDVFEEIVGR